MLRKLFENIAGGAKEAPDTQPEVAAREEYGGFELRAAPLRDGKQWRIAGSIVKLGSESAEEHDFIRADTCSSQEEAVKITLQKAKRIVDEQVEIR